MLTTCEGIAAVHIGGMTIHSFAGTGKGEEGVETLKEKVSRSRRLKKQWEACQVLIIDEISMVNLQKGDTTDYSYRMNFSIKSTRLGDMSVKILGRSAGFNSFFAGTFINFPLFL